MAGEATIARCFVVLRGAGLPFPSDPDMAAAMPVGWRVTLEHIPDAEVIAAVRAYVQADPAPVFWPKAVEIATLARSAACGRVASRPDFATLRRAYFEAKAHGERDVSLRIPEDVRDAILSKLAVVGGMPALRHAMMAQGSFELSRLEQAFNAASGTALVRR